MLCAWHVQGIALGKQKQGNVLVSENNTGHFSFTFQGNVSALEDCIFRLLFLLFCNSLGKNPGLLTPSQRWKKCA